MTPRPASTSIVNLQRALSDLDPALGAAKQLDRLIGAGHDQLPRPAAGSTLRRWQALAAVAACDLSLAKLYEGHTDALAILAEVGGPVAPDDVSGSWGVWAAEAPQGRTLIEAAAADPDGWVHLNGRKCWCSGAASADHALVTAWHPDAAEPQLVSVELRQPGVQVLDGAWHALGMTDSASLDVSFEGARARLVGRPGDYLRRPGFWQAGAGIAACWYGGTLTIAEALRRSLDGRGAAPPSPFRLAALGRIDVSLRATAGLLRESALWIDAHPHADAAAVALRVRLCAEECATLTLAEVGRALGATPFCRDARFARAAADLPVFIRQSHAERDQAALGERMLGQGGSPWLL